MIVLVETRASVAKAYIDGFERLGVAAIFFEPDGFLRWIKSSTQEEISAIEAVVAGDFAGREDLVRCVPAMGRAPIVALLDARSLESTLALFSAGFDEVICKPVHVREILARIHRIAERHNCGRTPSETVSEIQVFPDGRDPIVNGEILCLPRRERRILECLHRAEGAWITKTQVFDRVYGPFNDSFHESVIESHICRLRRRLRSALGYDPVESQRYLGYRLNLSRLVAPEAATARLAQSRRDMVLERIT